MIFQTATLVFRSPAHDKCIFVISDIVVPVFTRFNFSLSIYCCLFVIIEFLTAAVEPVLIDFALIERLPEFRLQHFVE